MSGRRALARAGASLSCALALVGCATSSFMTDAPRPSLTPRADAATLVFLRPEGTAPNTTVTVLDDRGRFVGDSLPGRCFAAQVEPGERLLVGWGANAAPLLAQLEPGRVYFIAVVLRIGAVSARTNLFAPAEPPSKRALEECTFQDVDRSAGQGWLDAQQAVADEQIRRAQEVWARYDEVERSRRRVGPR